MVKPRRPTPSHLNPMALLPSEMDSEWRDHLIAIGYLEWFVPAVDRVATDRGK